MASRSRKKLQEPIGIQGRLSGTEIIQLPPHCFERGTFVLMALHRCALVDRPINKRTFIDQGDLMARVAFIGEDVFYSAKVEDVSGLFTYLFLNFAHDGLPAVLTELDGTT